MTDAVAAFPDFFSGEEEKFLYRRQAAASYPFLAPLFRSRPLFRLAIDRKEPLQPAIAKAFGLDKGLVRRLSGFDADLPTPLGTVEDVDLRMRVCRALGDIDPNWWPKDAAEAAALVDCVRVVSLNLAALTGLDAKTLLSASKGKWVEFRERLKVAAGFDAAKPVSAEDLVSAARGVGDMIADYAHRILWPCLWKLAETGSERARSERTMELLAQAAGRILFKGKSASAILEISAKWHGQSADIARRLFGELDRNGPKRDERGQVITKEESYDVENGGEFLSKMTFRRAEEWDKRRAWPAVLEAEFVASNGFRISTLADCDRIFEIGSSNKICIGSYWMGISAGDGWRSGPMVLVSAPGTDEVAVCQFNDPVRGQENGSATALSRAEFKLTKNYAVPKNSPFDKALAEFEAHVASDGAALLKNYVERMANHRTEIARWLKDDIKLSIMSRQVGWNIEAEGAFENAMRAWGSMRSPADPDQLVKGPWVSSAYPVSLAEIPAKIPEYVDILETIAPDCDPVLDRRDARLEALKTPSPQPA